VPATVSVITTEDIDRENTQDIRDLVRNEPGVTEGNNPTRAAADGQFGRALVGGVRDTHRATTNRRASAFLSPC
jgi:hemoglobin/transferrin/lactoferrin receptor protein